MPKGGTPQPDAPAGAAGSMWRPFRNIVFKRIWMASVVANIGGWVFNAAAGWMMTDLGAGPLLVSLVQVASSLPMFLFALPAGALADIIDKRRFILSLEIALAGIAASFAVLVTAHLVTPWLLLVFIFLIGTVEALEAPSWQSIVPQLIPREDLAPAIAANSVGINISRAVGPALAGLIIAAFGLAAPFWLVAVSNFGVIGVFFFWSPPGARRRGLPAERLMSALRAGVRYTRNSPVFRATLARSIGFFLFASAYWALLPLVTRNQIGGGPELYGILLGAIGLGAIGGAFIMPRMNAAIGPNRLVSAGEVGTAVALALFGTSREPIVATMASLIAGLCWIAVLANLNVSAQKALPDWVRGRGLAMYVTVFFGTMTLGSAIWGELANVAGLSLTHYIAAAGALAAMPLTSRWKLHTGAGLDLTPSMHWPTPVISDNMGSEDGPVMITLLYRVEAKDRETFLAALDRVGRERRRDGAYARDVFQVASDDKQFLEVFFLESWAEHLRQHSRVTEADRVLEQDVAKYLRSPPEVTHYIAADSSAAKSRP